MTTRLHEPGTLPDFNKLHRTEHKRETHYKSSTTKTLTEFREFKLNGGRTRRAGSTSAVASVTAGGGKENAAKLSHSAATAARQATPIKPLHAAASSSNLNMSRSTSMALTLHKALVLAPSISEDAASPTPSNQRKIVPPVPLFSETPAATNPAPMRIEASTPVESTPATSTTAAVAPELATSSELSRTELEDDEFADGGVSLADILNDDAWKDEEGDAVPMPTNRNATELAPVSLSSALPPTTPRRATVNGALPLHSMTPRSACRGSIFGGAIRTPVREKAPNGAYTLQTPARLTISGVLPSAHLSRSIGAGSSSSLAPVPVAVATPSSTPAKRVAVAPAASPSLLKRQRCTETNNNLPSHSGLSLFGAASVPVLSSARPLLLSTPAKRAPLLSASSSTSSVAVAPQPQSLLLLRPAAAAASPMPVALGAAAFMSPAPKSARSAGLQH